MNAKIMEEAFNGARQMYESGDITQQDYLNTLRSIDTNKISESTPENVVKKQQLSNLIDETISSLLTVE